VPASPNNPRSPMILKAVDNVVLVELLKEY
jgi:hypothetical protein